MMHGTHKTGTQRKEENSHKKYGMIEKTFRRISESDNAKIFMIRNYQLFFLLTD
jgi:hypothetical protein